MFNEDTIIIRHRFARRKFISLFLETIMNAFVSGNLEFHSLITFFANSFNENPNMLTSFGSNILKNANLRRMSETNFEEGDSANELEEKKRMFLKYYKNFGASAENVDIFDRAFEANPGKAKAVVWLTSGMSDFDHTLEHAEEWVSWWYCGQNDNLAAWDINEDLDDSDDWDFGTNENLDKPG